MLADWDGPQSFDLLDVDEDFLFSALVQGKVSSGSFHGKVWRGFWSPFDDTYALALFFGQPAGIAFGSYGPCCCSVFHHRAVIAFVDLYEDAAAGSLVGGSHFFTGENRLVALFSISFMWFHVSFVVVVVWGGGRLLFVCLFCFLVEVDAKACCCFFMGDWLLIDGEVELLFDAGEGEADGHCLLAVDS